MSRNAPNFIRAFAEIVGISVWHERVSHDRSNVDRHANVCFRESLVGDEGCVIVEMIDMHGMWLIHAITASMTNMVLVARSWLGCYSGGYPNFAMKSPRTLLSTAMVCGLSLRR
jgi:hypothetical protein